MGYSHYTLSLPNTSLDPVVWRRFKVRLKGLVDYFILTMGFVEANTVELAPKSVYLDQNPDDVYLTATSEDPTSIPLAETLVFHRVQEERLVGVKPDAEGTPVDILYTAALLLFRAHFPDQIHLGSDGGAYAWDAGAQLVRDCFPTHLDMPECSPSEGMADIRRGVLRILEDLDEKMGHVRSKLAGALFQPVDAASPAPSVKEEMEEPIAVAAGGRGEPSVESIPDEEYDEDGNLLGSGVSGFPDFEEGA